MMKIKSTRANYNWLKLDNTAKLYPMLVTDSTQNIFRVTIELNEPVDPILLKEATQIILPRFPSFNVKLTNGFFWCYFEENSSAVNVEQDDGIILSHITDEVNNRFLFRVKYYNKNIILEIFHILSDGHGSTEFAKALTYQYLLLKGKDVRSENKVITINSPISAKEVEDSFVAHYTNKRLKELDIKSIKGSSSYRINGTMPNKLSQGVIQGELPLDKVLELSRKYSCTLTVFTAALALFSIFKTNIMTKKLKKSIISFIPINLRSYYPSKTIRNFVMFSRAGVSKDDKAETLEDFIYAVKRDLSKDMELSSIENKVNASVKLQRMPIMRMLPLPLKHLVMRTSVRFLRSNRHTLPISNVGRTILPESMQAYVRNIYYTNNTAPNLPISIGINSYNNILNVVFSRCILETDIEKFFFKFFTEKDIEVQITSNMWEM